MDPSGSHGPWMDPVIMGTFWGEAINGMAWRDRCTVQMAFPAPIMHHTLHGMTQCISLSGTPSIMDKVPAIQPRAAETTNTTQRFKPKDCSLYPPPNFSSKLPRYSHANQGPDSPPALLAPYGTRSCGPCQQVSSQPATGTTQPMDTRQLTLFVAASAAGGPIAIFDASDPLLWGPFFSTFRARKSLGWPRSQSSPSTGLDSPRPGRLYPCMVLFFSCSVSAG